MRYPKIVESSHYHIWTDALHARELARQAKNHWDRGTYVRWTITTGWIALEMACEQALETPGIGRRFKENLNTAIKNSGFPPINWGAGIWQQVLNVHSQRKEFVHINLDQEKLFPETVDAESSIQILREAIKSIFFITKKEPPNWIEDDHDKGWDSSLKSFANAHTLTYGAKEDDPNCYKVFFVYKGKEYLSDVLPPTHDFMASVTYVLQNIICPITAIKVYQGNIVVFERQLKMRGA